MLLPTPLRGPDGAGRRARAGPAVDRRVRRRQRRQQRPGEPPDRRPRAGRRASCRSGSGGDAGRPNGSPRAQGGRLHHRAAASPTPSTGARRRRRPGHRPGRRSPCRCPPEYRDAMPDLMARLEPLAVTVDAPARVVINERTGTVVVGGDVRIGPAAVAHGNLSVRIDHAVRGLAAGAAVAAARRRWCRRRRWTWTKGAAQLVTLEAGRDARARGRAP